MLATSMLTFGTGTHLPFKVYFDHPHSLSKFTYGWDDADDEGVQLKKWLNGNISGKYSIRAIHICFEEHDDALLCYLRYKG